MIHLVTLALEKLSSKGKRLQPGTMAVISVSIPKEWSAARRMNSLFGNLFARYIAGLSGIRDCTAGFRVIRSSILRKIDLATLKVQGYSFQVVLLHRALVSGARVAEVPVEFIDRTEGESKLGINDIVEFIINSWWIRLSNSKTFIKFLIVGASGVVVNLGIFSLLLSAGVGKYIASPLAIEASIISNFLLNNFWTFRWRKTKDGFRIKSLSFQAVSLMALSVSYFTFLCMVFLLPNMPSYFAQALGVPPAMLVNYFLNSKWTFRQAHGS